MVLVDTSIWIEYLDRFNPAIRDELINLLEKDEVATIGLILAELRHGCRSNGQVRMVEEALEPLEYREADRSAWLRAGQLAAEASTRGHSLEIGDCLLATIALREGWSVFTLDRDFERIPGLKLHRPRVA
jgi:predicted nucleic acid-binding protein